eukprot:jgi/Ulvmu1/9856/UM057_0010.1
MDVNLPDKPTSRRDLYMLHPAAGRSHEPPAGTRTPGQPHATAAHDSATLQQPLSDSAMTEATLALEGTASCTSHISQTTPGDRPGDPTPFQAASPLSATGTLEATDSAHTTHSHGSHAAELLTASGTFSASSMVTPSSTLARATEAVAHVAIAGRHGSAPLRVAQPTHQHSYDAGSPAGGLPSNPPAPLHQPASAGGTPTQLHSAAIDASGSLASNGAHHSESDTISDFIPALNPPSPHNYTPLGIAWRPLSRSSSNHDSNSPNNSARASDGAESDPQRALPSLLARAAAVVGASHVGGDGFAAGAAQHGRHMFDATEASLARERGSSQSPGSNSRRHSARVVPPKGWPPARPLSQHDGHRSLVDPQTSFRHWADAASACSSSPDTLGSGRGPPSLSPGSHRGSAGAPPRAPSSVGGSGSPAHGSSSARQLVAMKRAELERAARELAELEALAATRAATHAAKRSSSESSPSPERQRDDSAPYTVADAPANRDNSGESSGLVQEQQRIGNHAARPVLIDPSGNGRPRLPLQLQPREGFDVPEPPRSGRQTPPLTSQPSGVAAMRTLEESRANLAAIQAVAQHRPTSLPGAARGGPRPRSLGSRSHAAARFTLDEAAAILNSLPAVPEGEPHAALPSADDGLVRRPAGIARFLTDMQQLPPSAQRTAAEEQDYRRTIARRLQDQAHANLTHRSPKRCGAYPSLQPSSQDSMMNASVVSAPAYAAAAHSPSAASAASVTSASRARHAYAAAGRPPSSTGSARGSRGAYDAIAGNLMPRSLDGSGRAGSRSSQRPSRAIVVSGGGLSKKDVENLRRGKPPGTSVPDIDTILGSVGSQAPPDSAPRARSVSPVPPSVAYGAVDPRVAPRSTGSTLFNTAHSLGPHSTGSALPDPATPAGSAQNLAASGVLLPQSGGTPGSVPHSEMRVVPVDTSAAAQQPRPRPPRSLASLFCLRPTPTQSDSADSAGTPGSGVLPAVAPVSGSARGPHMYSGKTGGADVPSGTEAAEGADASLRRKMRQEMRNYDRELAVNCGCF